MEGFLCGCRGQQERAAASTPTRPPAPANAAEYAPLETPALKLPPSQKPGQVCTHHPQLHVAGTDRSMQSTEQDTVSACWRAAESKRNGVHQAFASPPPASTQSFRMPPPCLPPASAFLRRNGRPAASSYRRPTVAPATMAAISASVPKLPMSAFKGNLLSAPPKRHSCVVPRATMVMLSVFFACLLGHGLHTVVA